MTYRRLDATFEERVAVSLASLRIVVVVLAVAVLIAFTVGGYGFVQARDANGRAQAAAHDAQRIARAEAALARQETSLAQQVARAALSQASQARAIAQAVGAERNAAILRSCEAENTRNVASVAELKRILVPYFAHARTMGQRRQLRAALRADTLLINALVPHQNCRQVLRQAQAR